jgi:heat shock protein HslJ
MTIRPLQIASTLLCALPLIWTACGGSDTPEAAPPPPGSAKEAAAQAPATAEAPAAVAEATFADIEWTLVAIGGDAIDAPDGAVPTLLFNSQTDATGGRRMIGFSGCNRFFGDYNAGDDGSLSVGEPLGMTQAACPEPGQSLETALMKSLAGASRYSLDDDELTIESENGSLRLSGG